MNPQTPMGPPRLSSDAPGNHQGISQAGETRMPQCHEFKPRLRVERPADTRGARPALASLRREGNRALKNAIFGFWLPSRPFSAAASAAAAEDLRGFPRSAGDFVLSL